ncbi:MAG: hypothetical protein A2534_01005 [Candidatus Magasanikbacteria bacterium RIFOXYD2_FULL_39_9]|uniref:Homing endonuclease LAGLIDADG domain-containing protein n=1 Tax=Candidatus Magasanikbacteria bacterium RIFOXYD1_FULL_40_23 TaxID=1798705 RepID=A0A1F6P984_9BACT|nr:MAG: hypothetical protein A2563_02430 [Candidatus Magasanikbacteria bacterium RIFOXYD1_FULL_40_23]OGH93163.1 MAG: hypothetical protein A2534_01005 [Candidatus Magasanikbacteria bacterium RIFOXYD2_FULL_39_9]
MNENGLPSLDFISGLISTGGVFMWVKQKETEVPVFQIKMHSSQHELLELIKFKLGLKENIYEYNYANRQYLLILVRRRSVIENTIIPTFDGRLFGTKRAQFEAWKKKYFEKKLDFIYKHYA